jgi:O-antigen ligase
MSFDAKKLERLTLLHVAILSIVTAWIFGGGSQGAVQFAIGFGSLSPILACLSVLERRKSGRPWLRPLLPLVPLLGFNLLVIIAAAHPSFAVAHVEGAQVFVPTGAPSLWPQSARPDLALPRLWLLDALLLSAFNLLLAVNSRKALQTLLLGLCGNALLLAVFGSVQKFVSSSGLFFGRVPSPNPTFFATFIYHNHWGAYVIIALAMATALLFESFRGKGYRNFWHGPAVAAFVGLFFLAATLPLCGSRSCTALALLLLTVALFHGLTRLIHARRSEGRPITGPATALVLAAAIAFGSTWTLAKPVIELRLVDTKEQLAEMQRLGHIGARGQLYRDTLKMASEKPLFGWGLGSYGTVFRSYNTQASADGLPQYYEHAHSDWLELLAETGVAGALLLLAFFATPFFQIVKISSMTTGPSYLLLGCSVMAAYACIEFPFANPAVATMFTVALFGSFRWIRLNQMSGPR